MSRLARAVAPLILLAAFASTEGPARAGVGSGTDAVQAGSTRFAASERVRIDGDGSPVGDTYAWAGELESSGTIDGDLVAGAGQARLLGTVTGDVMLAGGEARIDGSIGDDLRWAGGQLDLLGSVESDALLAGATIDLQPGSRVAGLLAVGGGVVSLRGRVGGPVRVSGGEVELSGRFDGDVDVRCDALTLRPDARIAGDLVYESRRPVDVPEGVVSGEVRYSPTKDARGPVGTQIETGIGYLSLLAGFGFQSYLAVAAFVAGLLMILFLRPFVDGAVAEASGGSQLIIAFGVGLVSMLVMLMLGLLCLLLLPLGLGIWAALAALVYFGGLVGKIIAGVWLLKPLRSGPAHPVLALLLGVLLLLFTGLIPVIGDVFWLFVTVTGMGACLLRIRSSEGGRPVGAPPPGSAGEPPPMPTGG